MARQLSRRSGMPIIGLRFSNVMVREDYERFPSWQDDPHARKWNLWGYVDESHVAESVRRALAADVPGYDSFVIAAADTVMRGPSRELMAEVFPDVPVADTRERQRHAARHRARAGGARVRPAVQLARPRAQRLSAPHGAAGSGCGSAAHGGAGNAGGGAAARRAAAAVRQPPQPTQALGPWCW